MVSDRYGRSETNLLWRAYKDEVRGERRERARRTALALTEMEERGRIRLEVFNRGLHLRIANPANGETVDLWPTTGRWTPLPWSGSTRRGPWRKALDYIGVSTNDAAPGGADTPTPGPEVRRDSKMGGTT